MLPSMEIQSTSKRITDILKLGTPKKQLKIAALTTYYSNITSPDEDLKGRTINILEKLIYLAGSLGANCIEIVGGTRACGQFRDGEREYAIRTLNPLAIESDLLSALMRLGQAARKKGVYLALEIEPGPIFALNNLRESIEMVTRLRRAVGDYIGLNIDIGHMIMSGEKPSALDRHKDLVFHSHISDNAGSHYADLIPGTYHHSEFRDWLRFLYEVSEVDNGHFTNCVAIELEACPSPDWVLLSLEKIRQLQYEVESNVN
jgi:sugar phosphate isomerase/epimerase